MFYLRDGTSPCETPGTLAGLVRELETGIGEGETGTAAGFAFEAGFQVDDRALQLSEGFGAPVNAFEIHLVARHCALAHSGGDTLQRALPAGAHAAHCVGLQHRRRITRRREGGGP